MTFACTTTWSSTVLAARHALRLTQAELASRLDVTTQCVSNWECGRNAPWPKKQGAILEKLGAARGRPSINERILGI